MNFKPLAAAMLLISAVSVVSAADLPDDVVQYKLSYDETTSFGSLLSWFGGGDNVGFNWTVPSSVKVESDGPTTVAFFDLPSFTITAKPGWILSDPQAFLGDLVYSEISDGATTGILAYADISVNGLPAVQVSGGVGWTETASDANSRQGYFGGSVTAPVGAFNTFSVSNAYIAMSASGGTYSSIAAQPKNRFEISFTAVPVPEPETYAMMLAGLGALGWLSKRRQNQG